jgi:hypothetical protein
MLLASETECGITPISRGEPVTVSVVLLNPEWLADQLFWRHADAFTDRWQARSHVDSWRVLNRRYGSRSYVLDRPKCWMRGWMS